jgi:FMN phosphatase YigB (HAD superfamily)
MDVMSPAPRPAAVSLDLAGTLLIPHPSVGRTYARVAREQGHRVDHAILEQRFASSLAAAPVTDHPRERWDEVVERTFAGDVPRSALGLLQEGCWHAFADPSSWRLAAGATSALAQLRFLGLKVGALSNADERLRPVLTAKGLAPFLDAVHLGAGKPDVAAFARMSGELGTTTAGLVHVCDSRTEDAAAAVSAGARAVHVGEGRVADPFPSIRLLAQLPRIVRDWMVPNPRGRRLGREARNLLANLRGHPEERSRGAERELGTLDQAVDAAVRRLGIDRPIPEHAISAAWGKLLPPAVARRTSPMRILPDGKLLVHCESPVVRSEAAFHARALLAKVRELPGCRHVIAVGFVSG